MVSSITATFDHGVFRPDSAVDLPEASRVRLIVEPLVDEEEAKTEMLKEFDRICDEYPVYSTEPHLTCDQMHERR